MSTTKTALVTGSTDGLGRVVAQGAAAVLRLASAAQLAHTSGEFFDGLQPARAHVQAYDDAARQRLAEASRRLTSLPADAVP